ncbi:isochorismate synthase [Staphylococcus microti]|uniref:isochorismate synthase n=1 Tax=Staphylococcus microti TaxID=569857 RepID=A0A0D6XQ66_9STAP|nr:isochorismate synthase [Staphylococcus microti]KIX90003.1 isochorismate synthase [Staphylococcus microti]PNZ79934.1 isochorismate synthase [Staphylococcus microti]SUM57077.1 isochorismate synthase [Staphylococcus microti]
MTVDAREQAINEAVKQADQRWVSIEVKLSRSLDPVTLFHVTNEAAGNRFYFRLNDNKTSYFGYRVATYIKNDNANKRALFEAWQSLKQDILCVHPDDKRHHLRLCGGFQFSMQRTGKEWETFGHNHFILPEVLISQVEGVTYLTYTVERDAFSMATLQEHISYFEMVAPVSDTIEMPQVDHIENIKQDAWQSLVAQTVARLARHEKIVLSRQRKVHFDSEIHIGAILQKALRHEKNSYLYVLESDTHTFISQTPEQLFKVTDGRLYTKAVAGTIHRTNDEAQDAERLTAFLQDKKNLGEHQIVVDSILEDIQPFVKNVTYDTTPKILKNDHLYHLYTEISGELDGATYIDVIDALHPTPALGGYPKAMAMAYIDEHEFAARGLYGAPVGMIDIYNDCEFIVAIRSMLVNGNEAMLYAGAGIVKDSDPASEVAETALKFSPMMDALGVTARD